MTRAIGEVWATAVERGDVPGVEAIVIDREGVVYARRPTASQRR